MGGEKNLEDLGVGDDIRVEDQLDAFGMASGSGANLLISGISDFSTGVTGHNGGDPFESLEDGLGAPEAASGESCSFHDYFSIT